MSRERINEFYELVKGDRGHAPHYCIFAIDQERGVEALRLLFPTGKCDDMNFVLFGTSGVHGTYGNTDQLFEDQTGKDKARGVDKITVLVVHPRLAGLRFGHIVVTPEDVEFLNGLRESTRAVISTLL